MLKPGFYNLVGLLLKQVKYKENDIVATILTKEHGKLTGFAKNARQSIKRFGGGVLFPGTLANYYFKVNPNQKLVFFEKAEIKVDFKASFNNPLAQAWAALALELINKFETSYTPSEEVFELAVWYLQKFNQQDSNLRKDSLFFVLKYLSSAGFAPLLDECVSCKKILTKNYFHCFLSVKYGGLICSQCVKCEDPDSIGCFLGAIKILKLALKWPLNKLNSLQINLETMVILENFLWNLAIYNLDSSLKSIKVIKQLMNLAEKN